MGAMSDNIEPAIDGHGMVIVDFRIIEGDGSTTSLVLRVNQLLQYGWAPEGGPFLTYKNHPAQAMVKRVTLDEYNLKYRL